MKPGGLLDRSTRALMATGALGRQQGIRAGMTAGLREFRSGTSTLTDPAQWFLQLFGMQSKSGAIVNESTALTVATFGACVNILASALATPPLRLMRRTSRGAEPAREHPLYFLTGSEPNGNQTSYRWRSFEMVCCCLGGNGYSRIRRDAYFDITGLDQMLPAYTDPLIVQGGAYDGSLLYRYRGEKLLPDEVLHFRGLSTNGTMGISPIRALRESLGLSLTMQEFTARTFQNGARKPGLFEGPATMTREKAQEFTQFWQANYAGAENAGKNPFLFGGVQWKEAGFSNDDAQLLMMKNFEKSEIAGWFRIPEVLLGNTDKTSSWGTGIQQLMLGFVEWTLKPWACNWQQEMDRSLLTREEKLAGYFFKFDFTELLAGTPENQANFFKTLFSCGAQTSNEIRHAFGYLELPDGPANLRYVPTTMLPDNAARPAGPGAAATDPNADPMADPTAGKKENESP